MKDMKRILCLLLTLLLLLEWVPGALPASAVLEDGLCAIHHPAHDAAVCGYAEAVQESPCTHAETCDDSCKTPVTNCVFPHEDCGCTETALCDHQCSLDTGCISLVCSHIKHTEDCGYAPAQEGNPCRFAGVECAQCAAEQECNERCMNPDAHEGACTLYCETEFCALAQDHDGDCVLECGCPVTAEQHLEGCEEFVTYSTTLPMYARITGSSEDDVTYLSSMKNAGNSVGPWLTFVPSMDADEEFTGFTTSDPDVVSLEYPNGDSSNASLYLIFGKEGTAVITHTEGDTTYTFTVTVTQPEPPVLRNRIDDMGYVIGNRWQLAPGSEGYVKFYIGTNSYTQVDQEDGPTFSLTNVTVDDPTVLQLTGPDRHQRIAGNEA